MDEFLPRREHDEFSKRMEEEHQRQNKRITDLEKEQKQIYTLTISVKELAMSVKSMVEEQKEQSERIKQLEEKPGKRWDLIITTILTSIISVAVGAVVSALFLL